MTRVASGLVEVVCCAALLSCAPSGDRASTGVPRALGRVATSPDGMVVSGSALATTVGAQILGSGGNAVDAAIGTAFALAVVEPTQSGLGGRTQVLVRRSDGTTLGIDATNEVPMSYDPDTAPQVDDGYGVIAVPGTVAGLARLRDEAGSRPLSELIAPALELAERGFPLGEGEARRLAEIRDRLSLSVAARSAFLRPDGTSYAAGDTLRQPAVAGVLRAVAEEGSEVFYRGWIAERMASDIIANDGYVTRDDLAGYEAEESIVVRGRFGELDLLGTYIPASGATTIEALQILDRIGLEGRDAESRAFSIGQALALAYADRETAWNDERSPDEDAAWITSSALADERARLLTTGAVARTSGDPTPESANTTHVSVLDRDGMAVAMTQSLGPTGGSRVATEGLGFLYAASVGGYLGYVRPGDRPWSSQSPLVALRDDGPALVMGGAGARRIISALVATVVRLETEELAPEEALEAARLHPAAAAWRFEQSTPELDPPGARSARDAGHEVILLPVGSYFGRLNVIAVDETTGIMTGVADPRWAWGAASGPLERR